mmetsp:Transcript_33803/g.81958  ORF Transcript_33803/g.81958 Transcript_33803/m.81958 type:complete len:357 (+) Transcript_33803:516-1586(+)
MGASYSKAKAWAKDQPSSVLISIGSIGALAGGIAIYKTVHALRGATPKALPPEPEKVGDAVKPTPKEDVDVAETAPEENTAPQEDDLDQAMEDMAMATGFHPAEIKLQHDFEKATSFVRVMTGLGTDNQLLLYGLYKQATEGDCTGKKPAMWEMQKHAKWSAWKSLESLSKKEAKERYVSMVGKLVPDWQMKLAQGATETKAGAVDQDPMYGRSQSTLAANVKEVAEDEKNILHYACENKIDDVKRLLESKVNVDFIVEKKTSEDQVMGQTALHLASDHGFEDLAKLLVEKKASVNLQDEDGYTPLHYAVVCERVPLIKLLVDSGADLDLENTEGKSAIDFAEDAEKDEINEILGL